MQSYTVHEPAPGRGRDLLARAERIAFVREGFSWLAALFPLPWLLVQGMWYEIGALILISLGLEGLASSLGLGPQAALALSLALTVIIGFEARNLRRWQLARRGYRLAGVVSGPNREACERKFFAEWLARQGEGDGGAPQVGSPARSGPAPVPSAPLPTASPHTDHGTAAAGAVIGMFPVNGTKRQ